MHLATKLVLIHMEIVFRGDDSDDFALYNYIIEMNVSHADVCIYWYHAGRCRMPRSDFTKLPLPSEPSFVGRKFLSAET